MTSSAFDQFQAAADAWRRDVSHEQSQLSDQIHAAVRHLSILEGLLMNRTMSAEGVERFRNIVAFWQEEVAHGQHRIEDKISAASEELGTLGDLLSERSKERMGLHLTETETLPESDDSLAMQLYAEVVKLRTDLQERDAENKRWRERLEAMESSSQTQALVHEGELTSLIETLSSLREAMIDAGNSPGIQSGAVEAFDGSRLRSSIEHLEEKCRMLDTIISSARESVLRWNDSEAALSTHLDEHKSALDSLTGTAEEFKDLRTNMAELLASGSAARGSTSSTHIEESLAWIRETLTRMEGAHGLPPELMERFERLESLGNTLITAMSTDGTAPALDTTKTESGTGDLPDISKLNEENVKEYWSELACLQQYLEDWEQRLDTTGTPEPVEDVPATQKIAALEEELRTLKETVALRDSQINTLQDKFDSATEEPDPD